MKYIFATTAILIIECAAGTTNPRVIDDPEAASKKPPIHDESRHFRQVLTSSAGACFDLTEVIRSTELVAGTSCDEDQQSCLFDTITKQSSVNSLGHQSFLNSTDDVLAYIEFCESNSNNGQVVFVDVNFQDEGCDDDIYPRKYIGYPTCISSTCDPHEFPGLLHQILDIDVLPSCNPILDDYRIPTDELPEKCAIDMNHIITNEYIYTNAIGEILEIDENNDIVFNGNQIGLERFVSICKNSGGHVILSDIKSNCPDSAHAKRVPMCIADSCTNEEAEYATYYWFREHNTCSIEVSIIEGTEWDCFSAPSNLPSRSPTGPPSKGPTDIPSQKPSLAPTPAPSQQPTPVPSQQPTPVPSRQPTQDISNRLNDEINPDEKNIGTNDELGNVTEKPENKNQAKHGKAANISIKEKSKAGKKNKEASPKKGKKGTKKAKKTDTSNSSNEISNAPSNAPRNAPNNAPAEQRQEGTNTPLKQSRPPSDDRITDPKYNASDTHGNEDIKVMKTAGESPAAGEISNTPDKGTNESKKAKNESIKKAGKKSKASHKHGKKSKKAK